MSKEKIDWEDFKTLQKGICYRLINCEKNQKRLELMPHVKVLDLAVIFYHKESKGYEAGAMRYISNNDLEKWNVGVEEIYEMAKENTIRLLPSTFKTIEQVLGDIAKEAQLTIPDEKGPNKNMYVLSNEEQHLGASVILYPDILEKIYTQLKADFFVLPASVHESIIMLNNGKVTETHLQELVSKMNEHFVEEGEILSNSVYRYDAKTKILQQT